ncbi:MAG: DUF1330 domain-containing protein [Acidobacteria bacterium]|nr:MAG: DUF1330 domain-containing protein [Acidobacteriota bacterium]
MLNLLKWKPGGEASYRRYLAAVAPLVERVGGRVRFSGRPAELLIGEEEWDLMLVVEYPTRGALLEMIGSAAYREIEHLRHQALERSVLYAVDPLEL